MSEYRIKGETLTGIADAIRSKTGGTDPIPVPDMAAQIEGISGGGGGSSSDVCYVTFMNHDGTVELGKKAVAVGDDCADPIARGVFDTPTRESDAQYDYAFAGWSKNPDNVLDDTALDAVTEDRTVYAVYAATVRYYTITYYDSDGTTVLKSESLAYGSTPSYTPTSDEYNFVAWVPAVVAVAGDANYTATWEAKPAFDAMTWAEIAAICDAGEAESTFAVGDTKTLAISGCGSVAVQIAGFNHDDLADGSGKASMSIVLKETFYGSFSYDAKNVSWPSTTLYTLINNYLSKLPSDLQSVIKQVAKKYVYGSSTTIETSNVELWPLSGSEVGLNNAVEEGDTYPCYTDNDSRIVKYASAARQYALRGGPYYNGYSFAVTNEGKLATYNGSKTCYPVFGFCI